MRLTVIIPACNEERTITRVLEQVTALELSGVARQIIVIDDGSRDATAGRVEAFRDGYRGGDPLVFLQKTNGGKGSAIREGLHFATGDYVIIQDADLEYDPADIRLLLETARRLDAPVVYGSRNLRPGNRHSYFSFYLGGRFLSWLTNILYGSRLTDEATCYKLIRRSLLESLQLECQGFEFCPEVTAKILRRGIPILEVPVSYFPRKIEEGKKIRWQDGWQAIRVLIRLRFFRQLSSRRP